MDVCECVALTNIHQKSLIVIQFFCKMCGIALILQKINTIILLADFGTDVNRESFAGEMETDMLI
jgi:hypothetical protein